VFVVRKSEIVILNPTVGFIYAFRFEGSFSKRKLIDYNAERPNIGGIGMTFFTFNDFGRDIVWRAANCFSQLVIGLQAHCQPKIGQFDFLVVVE